MERTRERTRDQLPDSELACHPDAQVRAQLAARTDVAPEILYFLANDTAANVRLKIAANAATPGQAHLILARDKSDDVRVALAEKIARLLPDLTTMETSKMRDLALNAIEVMAQDELPRLRAILSEAVKDLRDVSHDLIRRLAFDIEAIVATPVLEFSPLLTDEDLLELVAFAASGGSSDRLSAVARRANLGGPAADAIARTGDERAVATLLGNGSAQIREETLDALIDQSAQMAAWQKPLVMRPRLSLKAIHKLSTIVADRLIDLLATRNELDEGSRAKLKAEAKLRLEKSSPDCEAAKLVLGTGEAGAGGPAPPPATAADRAKAAYDAGKIDDDSLDAALEDGDREWVLHGLSLMAEVPVPIVTRIVQNKNARALTAVAHRAKLSMRMAMRLQARLALIPGPRMLNARGGVEYPLSPAELESELEPYLI